MFNSFLKTSIVIMLVLTPQIVSAKQPVLPNNGAAKQSGIVLVGLSDLTDADQRRLNFYVEKITLELFELASMEQTIDSDEINRKTSVVQGLAHRFAEAAADFDLTDEETTQYFLTIFSSNYSGHLPDLLINTSGDFDVSELLFGEIAARDQPVTQSDDYIDLLRLGPALSATDSQ